ncbi:hypothetical protein B0J18DRAFT_491267 [Chaetomium sp. MPI-SDFR-AT-0129]|nr:hypothetical protein B0J18DRAFT_491267 [Chaetomium sp. MPI-SDFR-AT-0129]
MSNGIKGKGKLGDPPQTLFSPLFASNGSPQAGRPSSRAHQPTATTAGGSSTSAFASPATYSSLTSPTPNAAPDHSSTTSPLNIHLPPLSGLGPHGTHPPSFRSRESTRTTDRTDALWAEMQATLEAVELTANGTGSNSKNNSGSAGGGATTTVNSVFSPDHERKLDELRAAQIALAQAWARSEADEAMETTGNGGGDGLGFGLGAGAGGISEGKSVATDAGAGGMGKSTAGTGSARPGSSGFATAGAGGQGKNMEEETEVDLLLARKRREANDRYFQRVNQGVLDVVAKLEDVAIAMRAVEQESKELWGDETESVPGTVKS